MSIDISSNSTDISQNDDDNDNDDEDEDIPKAKKAKSSIKKAKPISDDEDEDIPKAKKAKSSIKKAKPISDDEDEDIPKAKKAGLAKGQVMSGKKVAKEVVSSKNRKVTVRFLLLYLSTLLIRVRTTRTTMRMSALRPRRSPRRCLNL